MDLQDDKPKKPSSSAIFRTHLTRNSDQLHVAKSAEVDPSARLGKGVFVGQNAIIGPNVTLEDFVTVAPSAELNAIDVPGRIPGPIHIGARTYIGQKSIINCNVRIGEYNFVESFVLVGHHTTIGNNNWIHPYANIGGVPQDITHLRKYGLTTLSPCDPEPTIVDPTFLEIGDKNDLFAVDINIGTLKKAGDNIISVGKTRIGNQNLLMVGVHVGHDTTIGHHCVLKNYVNIAGHAIIGERCNLQANTSVGYFRVLGAGVHTPHSCEAIAKDIPPFMIAKGQPLAIVRNRNIEAIRDLAKASGTDYRELAIDASTIRREYLNLTQSNLEQVCGTLRTTPMRDALRKFCVDSWINTELWKKYEEGRKG